MSPVYDALDALVYDVPRQGAQVGLEGVLDVGVHHVDVGSPLVGVEVVAEEAEEEVPGVLVPGEEDVGGVVEHVAVYIHAPAEAAHLPLLLEDHVAVLQVVCRA